MLERRGITRFHQPPHLTSLTVLLLIAMQCNNIMEEEGIESRLQGDKRRREEDLRKKRADKERKEEQKAKHIERLLEIKFRPSPHSQSVNKVR